MKYCGKRTGHRRDSRETAAELKSEHVTVYCPQNMRPKSIAAAGIEPDQNGAYEKVAKMTSKLPKK